MSTNGTVRANGTVNANGTVRANEKKCALDTCGDLCFINAEPPSNASMDTIASIDDCASIPVFTTDSWPTSFYNMGGNSTPADPSQGPAPSKRDLSASYGTKTITTIVERTVPEASIQQAAASKRGFPSESNVDDGPLLVNRSSSNGLGKRALQFVPRDRVGEYFNRLNIQYLDMREYVSSKYYNFANRRTTTGVDGLYGCTSVIIVSNRGVYVSHIYEDPMFLDEYDQPTSDRQFDQVFNFLGTGRSEHCESLTALIGSVNSPGPLAARYMPHVYVVTPYTELGERDRMGITTTLLFEQRAQQLCDWATELVSGPGRVVGYTRTSPQVSQDPRDYRGKAVVEFDPFQSLHIIPSPDSQGRVRVQMAGWRLWVENVIVDIAYFEVSRTELPPSAHQQKRDVGFVNVCASYASNKQSPSSSKPSASPAPPAPPPCTAPASQKQ